MITCGNVFEPAESTVCCGLETQIPPWQVPLSLSQDSPSNEAVYKQEGVELSLTQAPIWHALSSHV